MMKSLQDLLTRVKVSFDEASPSAVATLIVVGALALALIIRWLQG